MIKERNLSYYMKSEKGSVTLIVLVTILFIFILLSTNLIFISSKRKSQLQESMILQDIYQGDGMTRAYSERLKKENNIN